MKDESKDSSVMSFAEVVKSLAHSLQIPDKTVIGVLSGFSSLAAAELKNGRQLQIRDLGRLTIRESRVNAAKPDAATKRLVLIPSKKFKSDIGI